MAQQDQEIIADQASLPQRRKRGRPRKYDYPNVSYEQRSSQSNPTTTILRLHATSQAHPARDLGHGIPVPIAAYTSMGSQSLPVQSNPFSGLLHGKHNVWADVDSTLNLSYATQAALPATYQSTYLSQRPRTTAPTLGLTRACSTAISSHGPNSLLGQMVSGTLDGCFDAGYMLTVQVANTGHVLRGMVFDPHRCIPISGENDIAPLLPMTTPSSAVDEPTQTLVSVPNRPVATPFPVPKPFQTREAAASSQSVINLPAMSSLNTKGKKEAKAEIGCEVTPNDTDPTCGRNEVALEHTDAGSKFAPNDIDPIVCINEVAPKDREVGTKTSPHDMEHISGIDGFEVAPNDGDSIVDIHEAAPKDTEAGPKTSLHDMEHMVGIDEVTLKDAEVGSKVAPNDTDSIVGVHDAAPKDTDVGPKTSLQDVEHMVGIDEVTLKDAEVGSKVAHSIVGIHETAPKGTEVGPKTSLQDMEHMVGIDEVTLKDAEVGSKVEPNDSDLNTEAVPKVALNDTDLMVGRNGIIQDTEVGPTVAANDTDPMVDVNVVPEDAEVEPKVAPNDTDAMAGIEVATKDAEVEPAVAANDTSPTVDINLTPTDTEARPKRSDNDASQESPSAASQAEIVTEIRAMDS